MGQTQTSPAGAEHSFPASQALQLVELVKHWGVTAPQLLAEINLTEHELEDPKARLPLDAMMRLNARARALTGEPGIGIYLGLHKRVSKYGYLGFAAMNASTVREALELTVKFTPILTSAVSLRLRVEGDEATLIVDEHAELGDTHDIALFSFLVGLRQILGALTGKALDIGHAIDVVIPEPSYFKRFAHLLPNIRFERPCTQIMFDAHSLERPLITPDRAALRLAREECERQLAKLGFERSFASRVRPLITRADGLRSLDQVARALHVSPRTFKRRLAAEATTFSELVEQERKVLACQALRSSDTSLDALSERLGYSSVANFARAFRRWQGTSPAAYRRNRQPDEQVGEQTGEQTREREQDVIIEPGDGALSAHARPSAI